MTARGAVCILGAGPQGLAVAIHLLEAQPDLAEDLVVLDPSGQWLATWDDQFASLDIDVLRSPSVHHPESDPHALNRFVEQRQLRRSGLRYGQPLTTVFRSFCRYLIEHHGLQELVRPATVRSVTVEGASIAVNAEQPVGRFRHVIVATNPHRRNLPTWAHGKPGVFHTSELDLRHETLDGKHIVVVGGGLSAAHLACGALERGATVEMLARRDLVARNFDTEPGWLGPLYLNAYYDEPDRHRRLHMAREARGGGTIPEWMLQNLRRHQHGGSLQIHSHTEVADAAGEGDRLVVTCSDGRAIRADACWLATGTTPELTADGALRGLADAVELVEGLPACDHSLQICPGVHVAGRLAMLELGPAAGNLWGAREAARRITASVADGGSSSLRRLDLATL